MFHTIYILTIMFVIPCICWLIESRKKAENSVAIFCKWFIFWTIGVRALTTGAMQFLNSSYTMELLQVGEESKIIIMELGFAQFAIGLLGIISLIKVNYRAPAVISYGVFMLGASIIHICRIETANFEEILSLSGDIWVIVILAIFFAKRKKISE